MATAGLPVTRPRSIVPPIPLLPEVSGREAILRSEAASARPPSRAVPSP